MEVKWDKLCVDVDQSGSHGKKRILSEASGVACPGDIVALVGASGAGKTTLLNALAGRIATSEGSVRFNGAPRLRGGGRKRSGESKQAVALVTQDDTLYSSLTVFETLWYTAALRLPGDTTQEERLSRVRDVIRSLGLQKAAFTRVGTPLKRGLSGGERKRLNVACEMLTQPPVLLADEPTSGLDHVAALDLMQVLSSIARRGRTVIATVHQPSSRLFRCFNKVCVLAEGNVVYFGPSDRVAQYLASPPILRPCPEHYNVADHVLEVVQALDPDELARAWRSAPVHPTTGEFAAEDLATPAEAGDSKVSATAPATTYSNNNNDDDDGGGDDTKSTSTAAGAAVVESAAVISTMESRELDDDDDSGSSAESQSGDSLDGSTSNGAVLQASSGSKAVSTADRRLEEAGAVSWEPPRWLRICCHDSRWPTSWWQQVFALTSRAFRTSTSSTLTWLMTMQHTAIVTVAAIIWWQLDRTAGATQTRLGLLFFFVVYTGFTAMFPGLTAFTAQRAVLRRERSAGAFRLSAFYTAKCLADFPVACVYPIVYGTAVYWLCGLRRDAGAYVAYIGILLLTAQVAQALGGTLAALVMELQRAITLAAVTMLGFMLCSGFYSTEIPAALSWVKYVGFTSYGYQLVVFNEFLPEEELPCVGGQGFSGFSCPVRGSTVTASIEPVLQDSGASIAVLLGMYVIFRLAGYLALRFNA